MTKTLRAIDGFFFRDVSASGFGLMRVAWGATVLLFLVGGLPDVTRYYADGGIMPRELGHLVFRNVYRFTLLDTITNPSAVLAVYWLLIVTTFFMMVGQWPRMMTIVSVLLLFSFHERNLQMLGGGDTMLRAVGFILVISPEIDVFSLSRLERQWRRWRECGTLFPRLSQSIWPYRLLLWQAIIIYGTSAWDKAQGEMWPAGTTIAAVLHHPHFARWPEAWMDALAVFSPLLTWSWLSIEFAWLLLLVPAMLVQKLPLWMQRHSLKRWLLIAGVVFHTGITVLLDVGSFSFAMLVLYLGLLLDGDFAAIRGFCDRIAGRGAGNRTRHGGAERSRIAVLFDGNCALCRRSTFVLALLDHLRRLTLVDFRKSSERKRIAPKISMKDLDRALHIKDFRGRVEKGFDALRYLAWHIPTLWLALPLLYLPGAAFVGRRIYARIAANRRKCAGGTCVHR